MPRVMKTPRPPIHDSAKLLPDILLNQEQLQSAPQNQNVVHIQHDTVTPSLARPHCLPLLPRLSHRPYLQAYRKRKGLLLHPGGPTRSKDCILFCRTLSSCLQQINGIISGTDISLVCLGTIWWLLRCRLHSYGPQWQDHNGEQQGAAARLRLHSKGGRRIQVLLQQ